MTESESASSTSTQWPSNSSQTSPNTNNEETALHFQEILNRAMSTNQPLTNDNMTTNEHEIAIHKAATALHQAEILLLVTGAGFSADSGLATYVDVADIDAYRERGWMYRDLCRPMHDAENLYEHLNRPQDADCSADEEEMATSQPFIYEDEEMRHPQYFYGFWGQCINDYRKVKPHEGYEIIARWSRDKNTSTDTNASDTSPKEGVSEVAQNIRQITSKLEQRDTAKQLQSSIDTQEEPYYVSTERAGAFFFFTSNVDAHSYDIFPSHEIRECHGNTEVWQCRNFECGTNGCWGADDDNCDDLTNGGDVEMKSWERRLWRLPLNHVFEVDAETMSAPRTKTMDVTTKSIEQAESQKVCNEAPSENISKKRKSEAELDAPTETTEVLNYLQHQFNSADNTDNQTPAHIGQVHGLPRHSHLQHMKHPSSSHVPNHYLPLSPSDNWPKCPRCHDLARPAVLMFDDLDWVYNREQERRWQRWYRAVLRLCRKRALIFDEDDDDDESEGSDISDKKDEPKPMTSDSSQTKDSSTQQQPLKVLILEIGCGFNVPTCRMISETLVKHLTARGGDPTLVRVNPTHPEVDDDEIEDRFIGIEERGLSVLMEIDEVYRELRVGDAEED